MHIEKLGLINFKNYSELTLTFSEKINCLVGLNGSGKTNILDAIYYLSMTKSAHNSIDGQNIKFNEAFFSIKGVFYSSSEKKEVVCYYQDGVKKSFKVNKKDYDKLSEHIGKVPVVLMTPYDTDVIREGSETRRKFFDSILCQINHDYLNALIKYNNNLKQRNSALKNFSKTGRVDYDLLSGYNNMLLKLGSILNKLRKQFIEDFLQFFNDRYHKIGSGEELVDIIYKSQLNDGDIESSLNSMVKRDIITERSNYGTHKDDFVFLINGEPIKKFGSQGQQKTFSIALKLAQYQIVEQELGFKPILLLDDIFDKLDEKRIEYLLKLISDNYFGQVFITDARQERTVSLIKKHQLAAKFYCIKEGAVEELF